MKKKPVPPQIIILLISIFLFWTPAKPVQAIIHRHDVPPDQFLQPEDAYPAVFDVLPSNGVATLIAPEWAITAAHVTTLIPEDEPFSITIQGEDYEVVEAIVHPDWKRDPIHFDIALIHFAEPVEGIEPLPLYRFSDEAKQVATLVGRGDSGTGLEGPIRRDGLLRAATNEVDFIDDETLLVFIFDNPDPEARSMMEGEPTALEGVSGPGDSGGPALFRVDGIDMVAGISAFGAEMDDQLPGTYGTFDFYTRVSIYADWITATVANDDSDNFASDITREAKEVAPTTTAEVSNEIELVAEPEPSPTSETAANNAVAETPDSLNSSWIVIGLVIVLLLGLAVVLGRSRIKRVS